MVYVKDLVKLYTNILTEWVIMGFCIKRLLEIEVIKTIELLILLKYASKRTSTPNLKHLGVVLVKK